MNRLVSNLILGFFVLALVAVYGVAKQPAVYSLTTPAVKEGGLQVVLPDGKVLDVVVADNEQEQVQGLSGKENLPADEGMLFVFPYAGQHGIWMKDMKFPIDILWLNEDGLVVNIVQNAPVPEEGKEENGLLVYNNVEPAKYVLEVAAGTAETSGIKMGKKIVLS